MSLTSTAIKALKTKDKRYRFTDGQGLLLEVMLNLMGKKWLYRYTQYRKRKIITLGKFPTLSLAEARLKRGEFEISVDKGISLKLKHSFTIREFGEEY